MRYFIALLWLMLAAGWATGIVRIAQLIGGYAYIEHMGQSRVVGMLALMGAICVGAASVVAVAKRMPKAIVFALSIVGGVHLLNALGQYILYATNGGVSPEILLPFALLSSVLPTSSLFLGMPVAVGNAALLILPISTFALLFLTMGLVKGEGGGQAAPRDAFRTRLRMTRLTIAVVGIVAIYAAGMAIYKAVLHHPRNQGESWTLFERERHERQSSYYPTLSAQCDRVGGRGITSYPKETVEGLRIVELKAIRDAPARGWESGLAFFLGDSNEPVTVIEGLKTAVQRIDRDRDASLNPEPPFIEYKAADGRWKRFARLSGSASYTEQDAPDIQATRGLRATQLKTGFEKSHTMYGGRLEFFELATDALVGEHQSYAWDSYYGAHNNYSLIAGGRCSALPSGVDFITNQLAPHFLKDAKKHFVF